MIVGFTGTQQGMTMAQALKFITFTTALMNTSGIISFHHGDCIGADAEADELIPINVKRVLHPPDNDSKRAFRVAAIVKRAKPYLERNKDIVNACDILIACPKGMNEELRSGTWSTVRYARKAGKKICIIYPNGMVTK